jgi:hypothetical protein
LSGLSDYDLEVYQCKLAIELELLRRELLSRKSSAAAHWVDRSNECLRRAGLKFTNTPDPIPFPKRLGRNLKLILGWAAKPVSGLKFTIYPETKCRQHYVPNYQKDQQD